jgi:DNA uptake protein ComE-like DNA-binding protein
MRSLWRSLGERKRRELGERLIASQERVKELERELFEMRDYIERLEGKLRAKGQRSKRTSSRKTAKPAARTTKSRSRSAKPAGQQRKRAPRTKSAIDLNTATFEQLRSIGLSVTESARVIAHRDMRAGYASLDEIDEVPGLSGEAVTTLKDRSRISESSATL